MVYSGPFEHPYLGHYAGGTFGAPLAEIVTVAKAIPKLTGPEVAYFKRSSDGASLVMLGVQVGPMADLSGSDLNLQ